MHHYFVFVYKSAMETIPSKGCLNELLTFPSSWNLVYSSAFLLRESNIFESLPLSTCFLLCAHFIRKMYLNENCIHKCRRHINAFTFTTDRYKKSVTTKQNEQRTCWMCASCIHYHHQSFIQYSIPHSNSFLNIHSTSTDLHKSSKCVTAFRALPFMTMAITLSGHQPPLLAQETISECWNGEKICAHQRGKTANSFTLSDCQGLINEYSTVLSIR